ncbi:MAG: hypothetical protein SGCHY_000886 [Lobulomycetales sp.]
MEAHKVLKENGFPVCSYGTGSAVRYGRRLYNWVDRMPGRTIDTPNVYSFGTPYDKMDELLQRGGKARRKVVVINVEIKDNHIDAQAGGKNILLLTSMLHNTNNYITDIDDIMEEFREATSCKTEHALGWY